MRKVKWVLFLSFSLLPLHGYSQQYSVMKINVLGLATHRLGIAVEHSFGKKMSGQLMFESGQYAKEDASAIGSNYKVTGYSIIPEIRFYPFRGVQKSTEGLFAGVAFRYLRFTEQNSPSYGPFTYLNIGTLTNLGLDLGYKYSSKKFWIEFLMGYGVKLGFQYDYPANASIIPGTYTNDAFLENANKFLRAELSIGYVLN